MFERTIGNAIYSRSGQPTGEMSGVLATAGEASDGHILSIPGGECREGIPLCFGHDSFSEAGVIGSWTSFRTEENQITGTAQIEMDGVGALAESRQDLAHRISRGHLNGLSVRWEPIDAPISRMELDASHPAHVAKDERNFTKRTGLFFPKWRALEGSVVPIGADKAALIAGIRSDTGYVRDYWTEAFKTMDLSGVHLEEVLEVLARMQQSETPVEKPAEPVEKRATETVEKPSPFSGITLEQYKRANRIAAQRELSNIRDACIEATRKLTREILGVQNVR